MSSLSHARVFGCAVLIAVSAKAQFQTSTTLITTANPSLFGKAVTLTASVTPGATGKVTFYNGATVLGTSVVNGGEAALTTPLLPSGQQSLHAHYAGDSTYGSSNSPVVHQSVVATSSTGLQPAVSYMSGSNPAALATGDFNGDGKPDLVVCSGLNEANIFLGDGSGSFQLAANALLPFNPISVAVADFNGDGISDLAMTPRFGSSVAVFLGNGNGTFGTGLTYPLSSDTTVSDIVIVADFNGDGNADLAVTLGDQVGVLLGKGDGTFGSVMLRSAFNAVSLVAADFNGDGKADLVTGGFYSGPSIGILLGNGDGTFQAQVNYPTPTLSDYLAVADFNGDGIPDVAVSDYGAPGIGVLLGNGDGTLKASVTFPAGSSQESLTVGDINGDGKPDLIVSNFSSTLSVSLGNGNGTFQPPVAFPTASYDPAAMAIGDFNGDGKTDVAVAMFSVGALDVLLGGTPIVDLSVSMEHGPGFTQGQVGVTYTLAVTNLGQITSSGAVSIQDVLPSGFTPTGISGVGWNCTLSSLSCTRSDLLAAGAFYPPIAITANIAMGVSGSVTNTATISGGGDSN